MDPLFSKVPTELDFPREEREILRFWKDRGIFEKTLHKPAPRGSFVFYEGPPTANGLPHNGHVLTRVIKDLFPRYKTMRGWRVPRKAGWDTHGLPVEVEVEKELRLHGKAAIEQYGVEPFVRRCIESIFRYTREWEELTERVAFWCDLGDAYVTYHRSYVESVWWALAQLFEKGLLYQGHKVVWWWAQGGTALSAGEVGQGYKTVDDPSVYVAFPLVGEAYGRDLSLLVWTTTPWTLPSNMYAAVGAGLDYVVAADGAGRRFVLAKGLVDALSKKIGALTIEREMKGADLVGLEYAPPFDLYADQRDRFRAAGLPLWKVCAGSFVTLDAGTGIVHIAPAFGEDDYDLHRSLGRGAPALLEPLCAVRSDGTFIERFERYSGRWVKDCDKEISHDLKDRGLLVHAEAYRHEYPFCWRADSDPLIQYARPAWYIRTTEKIDRVIENNRAIQWIPEHIKEGRFGDFLANNIDWALSRERWWGTPLNVWVCDGDAEHKDVPASIAAIEARNPRAFDHFHAARRADPSLSEHLVVHKPWIDQVTFPCSRCGGTMRRVPEVIDVWFDSGCMPFAQWGYPHLAGSKERFEESFPADFISEAVDQTRGWFYSLLMVSTLVFGERPIPHPYKTCIVLGHVSDKEGRKESKSRGNYTPPEIILDRVAMEFAVLGDGGPKDQAAGKRGAALIAREDLEGLDLSPGTRVRVYRADAPSNAIELTIEAAKGLRRRLVVIHADDRAQLGVVPISSQDILPSFVPRLPPEERVTIEDPATRGPGADAFRWFFYAASPPWSATRHSLSNVRELQRDFAIKLRNVYSFFTIYANIDGFEPGRSPPLSRDRRPELDRWIAGELAQTLQAVTSALDAYDVFAATQKLASFVESLSNWWVRRSRARFWRSGMDDDKRSAYETLHACLVAVTTASAPFTPYAAEAMWQNLVVRPAVRAGSAAPESVHLADWPEADASAVDEALGDRMRLARSLVSLGLRARTEAKVRVRQPLRTATIVLNDARLEPHVRDAESLLCEELNVRSIAISSHGEARAYGTFDYKPDFRSLGPRGLGKQAQELKRQWPKLSDEEKERLRGIWLAGKGDWNGTDLVRDDIEIVFAPRPGFAAAADLTGTVILDATLDDELRDLGVLRELVNRVQAARKDMALEYTDRIALVFSGSERVKRIVLQHGEALATEVLAARISTSAVGEAAGAHLRELDIDGETVHLDVTRV